MALGCELSLMVDALSLQNIPTVALSKGIPFEYHTMLANHLGQFSHAMHG